MKFKKQTHLIAVVLLILAAATPLFAQIQKVEQDLVQEFSKLSAEDNSGAQADDASFRKMLIRSLDADPATLAYPFSSLTQNADFRIATSPDGLFRIYSWDNGQGGSMRFFENVCQYKIGSKVYVKAVPVRESDPSGFYSEIFELHANNKSYYLGIENGIYSNKDASQSIEIFTLENGSVKDHVALIKTRSGLTSEIKVRYDFFSVVDRPERPVRLIGYDPDAKIISIPVVFEDGTVSKGVILYKFSGSNFEKIPSRQTTGNSQG